MFDSALNRRGAGTFGKHDRAGSTVLLIALSAWRYACIVLWARSDKCTPVAFEYCRYSYGVVAHSLTVTRIASFSLMT